MRISLKQLRVFMAIAKYENVTKAAQTLFLSQSAASLALAELEMYLAVPLFDRLGKKLCINVNGQALLPKAIEIIQRVEEIEAYNQKSKEILCGNIYVGASSTIGNYIMPKVINKFINKYPEVKISLQVANTEHIISELRKFKIDVAFIEDSCNLSEIVKIIWKTDCLLFIASPTHRLAKKKKITLKDLAHTKWVLREIGSGTRNVFEKTILQYFDTINVFLELSSTEAIKQIVKEGAGISCLSKFALAEELRKRQLVQLSVKDIVIKRNFYMLIHKKRYVTRVLQAFQVESMAFQQSSF